MVVKCEERELSVELESIYLSDDDTRVSRRERIPFCEENESRYIGVHQIHNNKDDDIGIEVNPIITNEVGETESMKFSDEEGPVSKQESAESGCTEVSDNPNARGPATSFPDGPTPLSGDVNEIADAKNDEETSSVPAESTASISTDDKSENDSNTTLPSTVPRQRVKLVYMTPEEVLSHRERMLCIRTSHGPFLYLPPKRNAPYSKRTTSSGNSVTEELVRLRNQLRQENSVLQELLSTLQTQRNRRSNIKRV